MIESMCEQKQQNTALPFSTSNSTFLVFHHCFDDETFVELNLTFLIFLFQEQSSNIGHPPGTGSFEVDASTAHLYTCYNWSDDDEATKVYQFLYPALVHCACFRTRIFYNLPQEFYACW